MLTAPAKAQAAEDVEAGHQELGDGRDDRPQRRPGRRRRVRGDRPTSASTRAASTSRGSVGFVVLSVLVIGLLLTWTWRFRREFWHRNNVLLLLSLLLLFAVFALKLTAGRAWLPYALPLAAVGMLVTVLLDAGVAMVMTALIAVLAAAVNGTGPRARRLRAVRRDRGHRRRSGAASGWPCSSRPGFAVFVVNALVVITFALLGQPGRPGPAAAPRARRPSPPAARPSRPSAASP